MTLNNVKLICSSAVNEEVLEKSGHLKKINKLIIGKAHGRKVEPRQLCYPGDQGNGVFNLSIKEGKLFGMVHYIINNICHS